MYSSESEDNTLSPMSSTDLSKLLGGLALERMSRIPHILRSIFLDIPLSSFLYLIHPKASSSDLIIDSINHLASFLSNTLYRSDHGIRGNACAWTVNGGGRYRK